MPIHGVQARAADGKPIRDLETESGAPIAPMGCNEKGFNASATSSVQCSALTGKSFGVAFSQHRNESKKFYGTDQ
jgi:hypothetical protein